MGNEPSEACRGDRLGYSNASFSFAMKCPDKQYSLLSFTDWNFRSPASSYRQRKGDEVEQGRQVVKKVKMNEIWKLITRNLTNMETRGSAGGAREPLSCTASHSLLTTNSIGRDRPRRCILLHYKGLRKKGFPPPWQQHSQWKTVIAQPMRNHYTPTLSLLQWIFCLHQPSAAPCPYLIKEQASLWPQESCLWVLSLCSAMPFSVFPRVNPYFAGKITSSFIFKVNRAKTSHLGYFWKEPVERG